MKILKTLMVLHINEGFNGRCKQNADFLLNKKKEILQNLVTINFVCILISFIFLIMLFEVWGLTSI